MSKRRKRREPAGKFEETVALYGPVHTIVHGYSMYFDCSIINFSPLELHSPSPLFTRVCVQSPLQLEHILDTTSQMSILPAELIFWILCKSDLRDILQWRTVRFFFASQSHMLYLWPDYRFPGGFAPSLAMVCFGKLCTLIRLFPVPLDHLHCNHVNLWSGCC